ncbi:MAG: hypothetical protein AAF385_01305 [Pseudomonadota bacterium]
MGQQTPVSSGNSISRRDFLYLNSVLIAAAGVGACGARIEIVDDRRAFHVLRPEDLLSLRFDLINLRIEHRSDSPGYLVRESAGKDAQLLVSFPGQHVQEQTFEAAAADAQSAELPVKALAANTSQLAFRLPEGVDSIELSVDGLLNWQVLEPVFAGSGLTPEQSRIELPYGLTLNPLKAPVWRHSVKPITHDGLTEVWHTRLSPEAGADRVSVMIRRANSDVQEDFEGPITPEERAKLIGRQADVHELMLSPLGAWLDLKGRWESDPEISRWEQRTRAGQDLKALIESAEGFIYPFGHRATQLSVTERKLEWLSNSNGGRRPVALLRKSHFVVLKETTRSYLPGLFHARKLKAKVTVTPALRKENLQDPAFWIETASGGPFNFRFEAQGWDSSFYELEAPALFVSKDADLNQAAAVYDAPAYAEHRVYSLGSVQSAVAPYLPVQSKLDASELRTSGDTSLLLLRLRFAARAPTGAGHEKFDCVTQSMEVRIPSLQHSLDESVNQGWFELRDPDAEGNKGEVYAVALQDKPKIPLYFDQNPGASGGLAAPSFDVDGLSRLHGPIGNASVVADDMPIDSDNYFSADKAQVLGVFPLVKMLFTDSPDKPPAIPKIYFVHKKLKNKAKKKPEEAPDNGAQDDEEEKSEAEKETSEKKEASAGREIGLGLKWTVPLQAYGSGRLVSFEPVRNNKGESQAKLLIDVQATRVVGASDAEAEEDESQDESANAEDEKKSNGVSLRAKGKLSDFNLVLSFSEDSKLSIGFDHISIALGPAKKASPEDEKDPPATGDEAEKAKKKFEAEVEFRLAEINATGALNFIQRLMAAASELPPLPDIPKMEPTAAYPAKMPAPGDADLTIPLGPFDIPGFKWLSFDVSNISVGGSVGLNFKPRPEPEQVPDHQFSIRLASADKPLTLLAQPWGGIAHIGFNFTPKRLTGFQFSLGVLYKTEFDLKVTRATCEGSLAGMYTYWIDKDASHTQIELILRVGGRAKLWFMDIQLLLVAVGAYHLERNLWAFSAELMARVQIAFFSVEARFVFYYEVQGASAKNDRLTGSQDDVSTLTEKAWLNYQSAFAPA